MQLARETGFQKRTGGRLAPYDFLVLLTLGQLGMKHPSLEGMSAALPTRISREALHQRFTAPAAAFLRGCLQAVLQAKFPPLPVEPKLLHPFGRVWVVDSSSWGVREDLRTVLPGSGGKASNANCTIQLAYDYKQGDLMFLDETAGTVPDNGYTKHLPALLQKDDLLLIDQGSFKLETFQAIIAKGAYFVTRLLPGTTVQEAGTAVPIDLPRALSQCRESVYTRSVTLGQGSRRTSPCRLVCLRVSEQVAQERRRRMKFHSRRKGRPLRHRQLLGCDWTIFITNVPEAQLPLSMVRAPYTVRWQIELIFKQLKSIVQIHHSATTNIHRVRCELYGKLIAAVWIHRLHARAHPTHWQATRQEISLEKFYKRLQERAFTLTQLCLVSWARARDYLFRELPRLLQHCVKHHQRSRMTTLEMLEAGFDPQLHTGKSDA